MSIEERVEFYAGIYDIDKGANFHATSYWGTVLDPEHNDDVDLIEAGYIAQNPKWPGYYYLTPVGGLFIGRDDIKTPFDKAVE